MSETALRDSASSLPLPATGSQSNRRPGPLRQALIARWLPVALLYSCFVPAGLFFEIGELRFFAFRLVLIASLPLIGYLLYVERPRIVMADYLVVAAAGWALIAFMANRGFLDGAQSGGRYALDMLASYLLARVCIRSETDLRRFLVAILPGLVLVGAILALEAVTGRFRIIDLFPLDAIGGSLDQERLGLLRAFGPFSHAILGGLFMSTFAPLYLYTFRDATIRLMGIASAFSAVFTVSTAGLVNIILQLTMVGYRWSTSLFGFRRDWRPFMLAGASLLIVIELFSKGSAAAWIIDAIALNKQTGFYRLAIWEFGIRSVAANPLFGIGYEHYAPQSWLGESIDNHWLYLAVRFGLPQLVFSLGAVMYVLWRLARISSRLPDRAGRPFTGMFIALFCLAFTGISVAFFNEFLVFFLLLLGIGASLVELFDGRRRTAQALSEKGAFDDDPIGPDRS